MPVALESAPLITTDAIVDRLVQCVSETLGVSLYPYQIAACVPIFKSVLEHKGETITHLWSRQSGKSTTNAGIASVLAIFLPELARMERFADDPRFNLISDDGVYNGFKNGISIGIYAPTQNQSWVLFNKCRDALSSNFTAEACAELGVTFNTFNGQCIRLSNGGKIISVSASDTSHVECETHHLIITDETQDISQRMMTKSLRPMLATTNGTFIQIGTPNERKCEFWRQIRRNKTAERLTGKKRHYFFPAELCTRYNEYYRKWVDKEKALHGEDSDYFRMAYRCEWIFDTGMFISEAALESLACRDGVWSKVYEDGSIHRLPRRFDLVVSYDPAKKNDMSVVTVLAVNWKEPVIDEIIETEDGDKEYRRYEKHVVAWAEFSGNDYERQYHGIRKFLKPFMPRVKRFIIDSQALGEPIVDRYRADDMFAEVDVVGFPSSAVANDKMYKYVIGEIATKRVTYPSGPEAESNQHYNRFVIQMTEAEKEFKGGRLSVSAPEMADCNDDYVDGFAMAVYATDSPPDDMETGFGHNPLSRRRKRA